MSHIKDILKKKEFLVIIVAVVMLASVSALSLISISEQGGNARVVNYMGIVRGGTQRLIKEELYNSPTDALEKRDKLQNRLDGIVEELRFGDGTGTNQLIALPSEDFQNNMEQISQSWAELKAEIANVRAGADGQHLFDLSEAYFTLADETVSKAEVYSESRVDQSRTIILAVDVAFAILLVVGLIYVIRQQALQRRAEQFKTMAFVDSLTGIPNRMRCEQICKKIDENKPVENMAVFMFDMNNLKIVNDKFGHQSGDKLIVTLAKMLAIWAEANKGFAGRFGGDEFLAVFENTDQDIAEQYLGDLYARIDEYNQQQKSEYDQISFAAGYTINNMALVNTELMIIDADRAMYERKRQMKTME
jgi:diguanylate cyclase (GGDEF)-like protein